MTQKQLVACDRFDCCCVLNCRTSTQFEAFLVCVPTGSKSERQAKEQRMLNWIWEWLPMHPKVLRSRDTWSGVQRRRSCYMLLHIYKDVDVLSDLKTDTSLIGGSDLI